MSELTPQAPGRLVPPSGANGDPRAYLPDPLPPRWRWPERLWPLLLEARVALARADGASRHFDESELFEPALAGREAHASLVLEGLAAEPLEQLLFEIEPSVLAADDAPGQVHAAVRACKRACEVQADPKSGPLQSAPYRLQATLLSEQGPRRVASPTREAGPLAPLAPPPQAEVAASSDALERWIAGPRAYDPLVDACLVHYQLLAVQPFEWGSGIVARLVLAELAAAWCGLARGWLHLSPSLARRVGEYAERATRVATHGDWEGWIELGLHAAVEAARDTERRSERLRRMRHSFRARLERARLGHRLEHVVDGLFRQPVVRISRLAQAHSVSYPTAKSDVERLVGLGILEELRGTAQKTFYAPRILYVSYDDLDDSSDVRDLTLV